MSKSKPEAPVDPGTELINPISVAEMVMAYNRAIHLIEDAHETFEQAYQTLRDASKILKITFGENRSFPVTSKEHHSSDVKAVKMQLHRSVWGAILDKMDVWRILSIKKAEELRKRIESGDLPEITDEEIMVMFEAMRQNAHEHFKEFVLEVYDWLTPAKDSARWEKNYATNKRNGRDELGKKVILGWMIDPGWDSTGPLRVRYGSQDKLAALHRVFSILDEQEVSEVNTYQTPLVAAINAVDRNGYGQTEYFKFRACYNGNLHLEFRRLDLVSKFNQIAGNGVDLKQPKHKVKKGDHTVVDVPETPEKEAERFEEAFYWTGDAVVKRMLELVPLHSGGKYLEPSAGEGHIADCLVAAGAPKERVTCIEKNYDRVKVLLRKNYRVLDMDFLKFTETGWSHIYGNPPFNQEQDMRHCMHAYKLLAPGGSMVMVMSEHDFTASGGAATYFRSWLESVGGTNERLPQNSFKEAGTTWDTRLVVIHKDKDTEQARLF